MVEGTGAPLRPGRFDAGGDHRMAMAAAVAGAACPAGAEVTTITGWESVATSYPGVRRRPGPADRSRAGSDERRPAHRPPAVR